jgi:hypothetical protein
MQKLSRGSILAAGVVLVALFDLRVALRSSEDPITPEMLAAAAQVVRGVTKPGDILVHSPLFSMTALKGLGDLAATPHVPAPKLRDSRRIVVIDRVDYPIFGLPDPKDRLEVDGAPLIEVRVIEPSSEKDAGDTLFVLYESITPSTMSVERPAGTVVSRCGAPRGEGGFACPGVEEWLYVAQRTLKIDGQDALCVWAHPTTGGVIVMHIPAQPAPPAGRRLMVEVSGAFNDDAVRTTADGATVRTELVQNRQPRGNISVPNRIGWVRSRIAIEPNQPIELRTTTPHDGRRHYCLNAEVIEVAE